MLRKGIIFLGIFFLAISCDSLINNPSSSERQLPLYPLNIGNKWEYNYYYISIPQKDTTFLDPTVTTVVKDRIINDISFKEVHSQKQIHPIHIDVEYFYSRNDSVFQEVSISGENTVGLLFIDPKEDTITYNFSSEAPYNNEITAYKIDTTISTPVGSFTNCYFYDEKHDSWLIRTILVPGVGIIKKETYRYHNIITPDSLYGINISELTTYHIEN
jgi:hypothetical protein